MMVYVLKVALGCLPVGRLRATRQAAVCASCGAHVATTVASGRRTFQNGLMHGQYLCGYSIDSRIESVAECGIDERVSSVSDRVGTRGLRSWWRAKQNELILVLDFPIKNDNENTNRWAEYSRMV